MPSIGLNVGTVVFVGYDEQTTATFVRVLSPKNEWVEVLRETQLGVYHRMVFGQLMMFSINHHQPPCTAVILNCPMPPDGLSPTTLIFE